MWIAVEVAGGVIDDPECLFSFDQVRARKRKFVKEYGTKEEGFADLLILRLTSPVSIALDDYEILANAEDAETEDGEPIVSTNPAAGFKYQLTSDDKVSLHSQTLPVEADPEEDPKPCEVKCGITFEAASLTEAQGLLNDMAHGLQLKEWDCVLYIDGEQDSIRVETM